MLGSVAAAEQTGEELAAMDVSGELEAVIQVVVWARIRDAGLDHSVLVVTYDVAWMPPARYLIRLAAAGHTAAGNRTALRMPVCRWAPICVRPAGRRGLMGPPALRLHRRAPLVRLTRRGPRRPKKRGRALTQ